MSIDDQVLNVIKLNDKSFFDFSEKLADTIEKQLLNIGEFNNVFISGPTMVDIKKETGIPILKTTQCGAKRRWAVDEMRNLLAVAYDHKTGLLYRGPARMDEKQLNYTVLDHPEEFPESFSTTVIYGPETKIYDLRSSLNIPWVPSELSITLILYDWKSNKVEVSMVDEKNNNQYSLVLPGIDEYIFPGMIVSSTEIKDSEVIIEHPAKIDITIKEFSVKGKLKLKVEKNNFIEKSGERYILVPVYFLIIKKNIDQKRPITIKCFFKAEINSDSDSCTILHGEIDEKITDLSPVLARDGLKPGKYISYIIAQGICYGGKQFEVIDY